MAKIESFENRAQFYAAEAYFAHSKKGGTYEGLKKVIFFAITDYIVFPDKEEYKSEGIIFENGVYQNYVEGFSFTYVELPKFNKKSSELLTLEDKWYYFLKHAHESNQAEPLLSIHPEIKEAYDLLVPFYWSDAELNAYDRVFMAVCDRKGIIIAAEKDRIRRQEEEKREIARKLLNNQTSTDVV